MTDILNKLNEYKGGLENLSLRSWFQRLHCLNDRRKSDKLLRETIEENTKSNINAFLVCNANSSQKVN